MSIYVVRHDRLVKIGFSDDVRARFRGLSSMLPVPIEFVGYMPGDKTVERHLHFIFGHERETGEWFEITPRVQVFMDLLLIKGLPPVEAVATNPTSKAGKEEWARYHRAVRQAAMQVWPDATHKARIQHLIEALAWAPRRVRSIYDNDVYGRLLAQEVADLDAWLETTASTISTSDQASKEGQGQ